MSFDSDAFDTDAFSEDAFDFDGSGEIPGQEGDIAAADRNARMSGVISFVLRGMRVIAFLLTGAL